MPKYYVLVPFTGNFGVYVDADNEEDAKEKAFGTEMDIEIAEGFDGYVNEVEYHSQIVQGNFFYGTLNEIEVELDDE